MAPVRGARRSRSWHPPSMYWALVALVIQGAILAFGLSSARHVRSRSAALALGAGPAAIAIAALAWTNLNGTVGAAVSGALLLAAAGVAWRASRQLYARADAMHDDREARENVESAAGALVASAAYDAAIAVLAVLLGFLLES